VIRRTALDAAPARKHRLEVGPHLGLPLTVLGRRGGAGLAVLVEQVEAAAAFATAELRPVEVRVRVGVGASVRARA